MLHKFYGGVYPSAQKNLTSDRPVKKVFIPRKVVLPLSQHVGSPSELAVKPGDKVNAGDVVAKPSGLISSAIHASISGKVTAVAYHPTPEKARELSIIIESQGDEDQEIKIRKTDNVDKLSAEELLDMIKAAGIVGLGGAAFPAHVKLSPPKTKPIDTVILNGAECEPYLTCDHRLMLEKPKEIFKGIEIIARITGAKNIYVAIEDNKLSAIYSMGKTLESLKEKGQLPKTKVVALKTKYPQGAEKQMIKSVLNRVVPSGALPMDVGCTVHNVATAFAVYEAVYFKKPLIERVITITGACVKEPMNIWVRIGTLLSDLKECFGGFTKEPREVIFGATMMGIAQYTMDIPIVKGTCGVVFLQQDEIDLPEEEVCIRCGKCLEVCPMGLVPTTLMYRVKHGYFQEAQEMGLAYCHECGSCAYTCPAKIPLLDYMKLGKSKILSV